MLAVLTVVVVIAFNTFGGGTRDVQVPDMRGQVSADAIAALQNRGFKTRTLQKPDSTDPARPRHQHRPGRQRVGGRGRRDHHQRLHRTRTARGAGRVIAELLRCGQQAESRRVRQVQAGELPVDARADGQGDRDQPAGQSDVGDHQR